MRKFIVMMSVLCVVGSVRAATSDWKTTAIGDNWFIASNWSDAVVPTSISDVRTYTSSVNATYMPRIATTQPGYTDATANTILVGGATGGNTPYGSLTIDSGTLTTTYHMYVGCYVTSQRWGILNMNGGSLNVGTNLAVGYSSSASYAPKGWLYMNGGLINVSGRFILGDGTAALTTGTAKLYGGTINADSFVKGLGAASVDMKNDAKIIVNGDARTTIASYVTAGWLFTSQGAGYSIAESYDTAANKTTVSVVPEPATMTLLGLGLPMLLRKSRKMSVWYLNTH